MTSDRTEYTLHRKWLVIIRDDEHGSEISSSFNTEAEANEHCSTETIRVQFEFPNKDFSIWVEHNDSEFEYEY